MSLLHSNSIHSSLHTSLYILWVVCLSDCWRKNIASSPVGDSDVFLCPRLTEFQTRTEFAVGLEDVHCLRPCLYYGGEV